MSNAIGRWIRGTHKCEHAGCHGEADKTRNGLWVCDPHARQWNALGVNARAEYQRRKSENVVD